MEREPNLKEIEDFNGSGSLEHKVLFYQTISGLFITVSVLLYLYCLGL